MAGAKLKESPSEIDTDVRTDTQKASDQTWVHPAMPIRTMGSLGSDAGQRYCRPLSNCIGFGIDLLLSLE